MPISPALLCIVIVRWWCSTSLKERSTGSVHDIFSYVAPCTLYIAHFGVEWARDEKRAGAGVAWTSNGVMRELDLLQHVFGNRDHEPAGHGVGRREKSRGSKGIPSTITICYCRSK